jgi:broad specificity phosphatase PhoE
MCVKTQLRELDFGDFDSLTYEENLARHPDRFEPWLADPWHVRPPSGETLAELTTRIEAWVAHLPSGQSMVAFTHGGPIRVMLARAFRVSFADAQRIPVGLCGAVRLRLNAGDALITPSRPQGEQTWP